MAFFKFFFPGRTVWSLIFLGSCLFHVSAHAALFEGPALDAIDNEESTDNIASPPPPEITEIIINAERPARLVLEEAYEAQEKAFALFNDLNSNDEYDITCGNHTPTGTRIAQRRCEPLYYKNAQFQATQDYLQGLSIDLPSEVALWQQLTPKTEHLNKEIRELALEHPELAESLLLYNQKMQEYDAVIKARGWLYQFLHRDE